MTYCEYYDKEIKNDEWREHIISEKHLELEKKYIASFFQMKYDNHSKNKNNHPERARNRSKNSVDKYHLNSELHQKNEKKLEF